MQKLTGISSGQNKKVVGQFTPNPKKLVLHFSDFSMIFYTIYKNQPNHKYYLSYPFAGRLSEGSFLLQCSPWGAGSSAVHRNSASSPAFLAGRGRGEGLGVTGARFRWLDGGGAAPASGLGGAGRHRPPGCQRRCAPGLGSQGDGSDSC
jgi:hypothetical protein